MNESCFTINDIMPMGGGVGCREVTFYYGFVIKYPLETSNKFRFYFINFVGAKKMCFNILMFLNVLIQLKQMQHF